MPHPFRKIKRPLQGLHAAEAAAGHCGKLVYAEVVRQPYLRLDPVFHGHDRETRAIAFSRPGIHAGRTGGAMTAAKIIHANHKKLFGIDGLAGTDHIVPPADALGIIVIISRNMVVA